MRNKPMLAYPVSAKPINYEDKIFMQPKLDGVRCVIQYDSDPNNLYHPKHLRVQAFSRTGKVWKNIDHILFNLYPWFILNPNVILDGELYNHDLKDDFNKIISLVRKSKPTDQDRLEAEELTQFHCYDIIDENMSYSDRQRFIYQTVPRNHCVFHVPTRRVFSEDQAQIIHRQNLNDGYEGSILRTNDNYACKRSHNLRKFKDFHDTEALITGWVEGKGKRIGTIGKFLAVDSEGNEFGMPVMDKFKILQANFETMKDWVGQEATFTYFERTKANSYRHPLFKALRNYE